MGARRGCNAAEERTLVLPLSAFRPRSRTTRRPRPLSHTKAAPGPRAAPPARAQRHPSHLSIGRAAHAVVPSTRAARYLVSRSTTPAAGPTGRQPTHLHIPAPSAGTVRHPSHHHPRTPHHPNPPPRPILRGGRIRTFPALPSLVARVQDDLRRGATQHRATWRMERATALTWPARGSSLGRRRRPAVGCAPQGICGEPGPAAPAQSSSTARCLAPA